MSDNNFGRVEEVPAETMEILVVERVAHHGMPEVRKVGPNLVHDSGFNFDPQQCVLPEVFDGPVVGNRFPSAFPTAGGAYFAAVKGIVLEPEPHGCGLEDCSVDQRPITLPDPSVAKLRAEELV